MSRANKRTAEFKLLAMRLPERIQALAAEAYERFLTNPAHPALALHQLKDTKKGHHRPGSWAVSVGSRYRAIFVVDGDVNVWYWIGSHESYNNFLGLK